MTVKKRIDTYDASIGRPTNKTPVLVSNEPLLLHPAERPNRKPNKHQKKVSLYLDFFFARFDKISVMVGDWSA